MKNLLLVLSLVITASPAFASRARLESLGEGKDGSYYLQDDRDIFLNPAQINNYKKKLFLELGTSAQGVDSMTNQTAQGGFTNTFGDFTYGLYLDHGFDRFNSAVVAGGTLNGVTGTTPDHAFDFFFGGENGSVKYGASVFWAGSLKQNVTSLTSSVFGFSLGANMNNFAVFTTIGATADAKQNSGTTPADTKGKVSVDAGVTYAMDEMTYFGKFSNYGATITGGSLAATGTDTLSTMAFGVGAGWKHEASKSVTMNSRVGFDYETDGVEVANTGTDTKTVTKFYNIPLTVGAEAVATSWLKIRGSLSHSLFGQAQQGAIKNSFDGMNTVAMGMGLTFGDLVIDGLLSGSSQTAAAANGVTAQQMGMNTQSGSAATGLGLGTLMTRVSLTYNF